MSALVTMSVDWMSGSCTCSPQPHDTNGSKPAAGSAPVGMVTMTCVWVSPEALSAASSVSVPSPPSAGCEQPASVPPSASAPLPANASFANERRERAGEDVVDVGMVLLRR